VEPVQQAKYPVVPLPLKVPLGVEHVPSLLRYPLQEPLAHSAVMSVYRGERHALPVDAATPAEGYTMPPPDTCAFCKSQALPVQSSVAGIVVTISPDESAPPVFPSMV
jgi:hypothetical protein